MHNSLLERLLNSIEADRLIIFIGAGLSMAAPSNVPSAVSIAQALRSNYESVTGAQIPPACGLDLEKIADFFLSNNQFYSVALTRYVAWGPFRGNPNHGHNAVADFLSARILQAAITTNVDYLVEKASESIGEPDFQTALDGLAMNQVHSHSP